MSCQGVYNVKDREGVNGVPGVDPALLSCVCEERGVGGFFQSLNSKKKIKPLS